VRLEFGLQATLVYRFGRALRASHARPLLWPLLMPGWPLYFLLAFLMRRLYGIDLDLSADIGRGLYVGHYGGIRLVNCRLGNFVTVGEQCRIGLDGQTPGPVIGDRVWLGGHVHIRGPIRIGDDVTICSGALAIEDVPSRAMLGGRPARILSRDYDNRGILGAGVDS
jgi:serine O-acetyltransferase